MTSIKLTVSGAQIQAKVCGPLTAGMVGIPVTILYDSEWEGLTKTLVCKGGELVCRVVPDISTETTVTPEVMRAGLHLHLGVEGRNADGTLVIPTLWADCGLIRESASVEAEESTARDTSLWAQLLNRIGTMEDLTTGEKDTLVGAVNELSSSCSAHNTDLNAHPDIRTKLFQLTVQSYALNESGGLFTDRYGRYLNPPMAEGTAYATAERFNGAVVYRKLVNLGTLGTAGTTIEAAHQCSCSYIIGCRAIAVQEGGSCREFTCGSGDGSVQADGETIVFSCLSDLSAYTGYAEIRYIQ